MAWMDEKFSLGTRFWKKYASKMDLERNIASIITNCKLHRETIVEKEKEDQKKDRVCKLIEDG